MMSWMVRAFSTTPIYHDRDPISDDVKIGMWKKSKPGDYTTFRTFIFGITSQSMFPNGVVYEGVRDEPLSFRGESGANDSMASINHHHHKGSVN